MEPGALSLNVPSGAFCTASEEMAHCIRDDRRSLHREVSRLYVNASRGRASPHKICMLLAVIDLARGGGRHRFVIF
jgi:hypothetical protein